MIKLGTRQGKERVENSLRSAGKFIYSHVSRVAKNTYRREVVRAKKARKQKTMFAELDF